jgi:ligand-binding sensor protein/sugar diacid utilization regulator/putative methionine-R-sulfoxide reductase with GAF domain
MEAATDLPEAQPDAASTPPWQLTDLISVETLQSIQDAFARVFALPTVIVDTNGVDATAITHRLPFCEDLTRTSPIAGPRCAGCDRSAMREAADTSRPAIFKCWNGLYDAAIPIAPKGHVLGYFLCGQILTEAPDPAEYARTAAEIGVDPDAYTGALRNVKIVSRKRYEASVESMHVLAGMIAEQAAAAIDNLEMLEQAHRAREGSAQLVLELDTILEALRDIGSQPDYQATLASITDNLARLIPWDSCVIYLPDDEREELVPVVVRDPFPDNVLAYRPRVGRGLLGKAALGGAGRRFLDVTREPDFEPIPGVPAEPESALVMPMTYKDTVSGVIILSRFERRTFTEHELRVLEVFSSQASISIQVSKLASENAQRLREERAFGRLRLAMGPRTKLESMLSETANAGLDLFGADAAVVSASSPTTPTRIVRSGITEHAATSLLHVLEPVISRATERGEPEIAPLGSGSALVLPLAPGEQSAFAVLSRRAAGGWDRRLVSSLAAQAALGIEKVRMHDRERQLLLEYQRLSELGTELVTARDAAEARHRLLLRTPEIFSADACFIALLDQGPDAIAVELRHGPRTEERSIKLEGRARLASVRLRDTAAPDRSVFDTWSEEVFASVGPGAGLATWLAEPMLASNGSLGGLFIGWRSPQVQHSPEQRRILRVLAGSAGTALSRFAAHLATDSRLRDRLLELEALTGLAQRLSGLTRERPILDELLAALRRVGRLDGAVYGTSTRAGVRIERADGLDPEASAQLAELLAGGPLVSEGGRIAGRDGSEVVVIPIADAGERDAFFAGVGPPVSDDQRDRVMATLARYGSVALENAQLHDRKREAIARLERQHEEAADQYTKLERILSVHETLALAVLEGRGLASVVRSLAGFLQAGMLALAQAPQERVLASWPPDSVIDWRPTLIPGQSPRTTVTTAHDHYVVAAPAVVDGETLAWMVARMDSPPGDVERAAVEYAALLAAIELLRERTANEVETRLRGGMLEELFSRDIVEELAVKQALAFGYDLARPSRVFLIEAAPVAADSKLPAVETDAHYATLADLAKRWSTHNLVALRGGAIVVVVPEAPDGPAAAPERRFEDHLAASLPLASLNTAVGTRCESVADYRESYLAARRGLDLLRLLGGRGGVFSFRVSNLESMLLQSTRPEVVVKYISRYVEPLERYDREHTSDLRRTLEVYYESGSTLEEAARRLHVHVSTLRYRLKRATALLDVDVKDPATSLDVQVALKAARVLLVHRG